MSKHPAGPLGDTGAAPPADKRQRLSADGAADGAANGTADPDLSLAAGAAASSFCEADGDTDAVDWKALQSDVKECVAPNRLLALWPSSAYPALRCYRSASADTAIATALARDVSGCAPALSADALLQHFALAIDDFQWFAVGSVLRDALLAAPPLSASASSAAPSAGVIGFDASFSASPEVMLAACKLRGGLIPFDMKTRDGVWVRIGTAPDAPPPEPSAAAAAASTAAAGSPPATAVSTATPAPAATVASPASTAAAAASASPFLLTALPTPTPAAALTPANARETFLCGVHWRWAVTGLNADFTVNTLLYDPIARLIVDRTGTALAHLSHRRLCAPIGSLASGSGAAALWIGGIRRPFRWVRFAAESGYGGGAEDEAAVMHAITSAFRSPKQSVRDACDAACHLTLHRLPLESVRRAAVPALRRYFAAALRLDATSAATADIEATALAKAESEFESCWRPALSVSVLEKSKADALYAPAAHFLWLMGGDGIDSASTDEFF